MVNEISTTEQVEEYLAALATEKAGYSARIARVRGGGEDKLDEKTLADRVKQVQAEIARASKLIGKTAKAAKADEDNGEPENA